ncbi:MAG TPA: phosphotransferase [Methylomirabilota bacterium]|nr:phosphotransferase [Methylomirabilota bacterium]
MSLARLDEYLTRVLGERVDVLALRSLGGEAVDDPKGFGYGVPFEVECRVGAERRALVVSRTRPAHGFGHDYPADRAWQALYGHRAYNDFPRHVRSLDVGFVRSSGEMVSAADAVDFFQLVEKADGRLYWLDLDRLLDGTPDPLDAERACALAGFLANVHRARLDEPTLYARRIRELVGHGECVMGIVDSFPHPWPVLPPDACEELELAMVRWRWRLRDRVHRLSRTHGDFHPWNILFREGTDFSVLDRSRGEWGEPADDVAALGINYLFFGMRKAARHGERGVAEPFRRLFHGFLSAYIEASRDYELLETLPPFLAFRALVLAHPRWYPDLPATLRGDLAHLATSLAAATRFDPADLSWLCGVAR